MSIFKKTAAGAVALSMGVAMAACSPPHEKDATNREHAEVTAGPTKPSLAEVPSKPSPAPGAESTAPENTDTSAEQGAAASTAPHSPEKHRAPSGSTPMSAQRSAPTEVEQAPAPQNAQAPAAN